eukprot:366035-Chlamydomonas_euryale.AAC.3
MPAGTELGRKCSGPVEWSGSWTGNAPAALRRELRAWTSQTGARNGRRVGRSEARLTESGAARARKREQSTLLTSVVSWGPARGKSSCFRPTSGSDRRVPSQTAAAAASATVPAPPSALI